MSRKYAILLVGNSKYNVSTKNGVGEVLDYLAEIDRYFSYIIEHLLINRYAVYAISKDHSKFREIAIRTSEWLMSRSQEIRTNAKLPKIEYICTDSESMAIADSRNEKEADGLENLVELIDKKLQIDPSINPKIFIPETILTCYLPLLPLEEGADEKQHKKQSQIFADRLISWANGIREYAGLPLFRDSSCITVSIPDSYIPRSPSTAVSESKSGDLLPAEESKIDEAETQAEEERLEKERLEEERIDRIADNAIDDSWEKMLG
ncbi:MAG: hypothetical protein AAFY50_06295 [Cyanobacteria bacterium J06648_1]